jgi:hypothetical protein
MTEPLILKRAPVGDNQDDYDVLENGVVVGRIFTVPTAPPGRPWMWASGHSAATVKRAAHGYEATREEAMAAFAKSWRGSCLDREYVGDRGVSYPGPIYPRHERLYIQSEPHRCGARAGRG